MSGRLKTVVFSLILAAFSIGLALGVLELALRAIYGGSRPYNFGLIIRHDASLGWELVPGHYEFFNVQAFRPVRFDISPFGLRSAAQAVPKARRLTLIGDSFVFAEALSDGERFSDLLQAKLGAGYEVVNAGVPGFGTGQEALLAERLRGKGFELGEHVLFVFFSNDISDNAGLDYSTLTRDPSKPEFAVRAGALESTPVPAWPQTALADDLARRSLAMMLIQNRLEIVVAMNPWMLRALAATGANVPLPRAPGIIQAWYAPGWQDRWQRTDGILRFVLRSARERGARVSLVFVPSPFQTERVFDELIRSQSEDATNRAFLEDVDRPQRHLRALCAEEGVEWIDVTAALRAPRDAPAYFLREGHLNALGSSIVSDALLQAVRE